MKEGIHVYMIQKGNFIYIEFSIAWGHPIASTHHCFDIPMFRQKRMLSKHGTVEILGQNKKTGISTISK